MAARIPFVAGNWKMNTTVAEGLELAGRIAAAPPSPGVEVAVLPPFTHLWPLRDVLRGTGIMLGAQDCFWEPAGAFTGEISPAMLAGLCELVLVGHSERRALGETDQQVGGKLVAALGQGLRVIVAVGETLEQRRAGDAVSVVHRHLDGAFAGVGAAAIESVVVAYEPVWAIGTGVSASSEDAQSMCLAIRKHVVALLGADAGARLRVLYGGSVSAANAAELFACPDIDGGLIGGASLKADAFGAIVDAAASVAAAADAS